MGMYKMLKKSSYTIFFNLKIYVFPKKIEKTKDKKSKELGKV
jgi:hypothetical protein